MVLNMGKDKNYWDCFLLIQYLEDKQKTLKSQSLQESLNVSGLDSGESCVKWMAKNDLLKLKDFWIGNLEEMYKVIFDKYKLSDKEEMRKINLIVLMVNQKGHVNNTIDLDSYEKGLSDMYDRLNVIGLSNQTDQKT